MRYILYRKRTFSEKFNLALEWVRDNWRPLLKYTTIFLLPVSLLQGFGQNSFYSDALQSMDDFGSFASSESEDILGLSLYYICSVVGGFFSFSLFFSLLKFSFIDDRDLSSLTFREVWKAMTHNMVRLFVGGLALSFLCGLVLGVCSIFLSLLAFIHIVGAVFAGIGFIAIFFALVLLLPFFPIYLLTDNDFIGALSDSLHLGWNCYWGFLGTTAVMTLLVSVLSGFGNTPFFIFAMVKAAFIVGDVSSPGVVVDFLSYLASVLGSYVSYLAGVLTVLIVTIQYGHAADKIDGVSTDDEIEKF